MTVYTQSEISKIIIDEIIVTVPVLSRQDISMDKGFFEMGIASLEAIEIVDNLSRSFQIPINATALFDKPNLWALSQYIFQQLSEPIKINPTEIENPLPIANDLIAVVGMSCRFPKAADLESFRDLLLTGTCAVRNNNSRGWDQSLPEYVNTFASIENYNEFAADVFGISDQEARLMDPQQRILLEQVWLAIEDAGYSAHSLKGTRTGVFVGISSHDYIDHIEGKDEKNIFAVTGNAQSIAANRISYVFDFQGPSIAVDTACSSSLVALNLACQSLQAGEIDWAIVGGVNLILKPEISMAFAAATMLSPDGLCKTFSDEANGYVRGEGAGVIVLHRNKDAQKKGHRVYAEILSSAVNQDGKSSSLTAPNGSAQEELIKYALKKAHLNASDIIFHEAHGTGTALGDPIEVLALERVHQRRNEDHPLLLSSVKSNIGHLEAAAGMAGLIKVILSLQHKTIFKTLHFKKINSLLKDKIPHLKILTENFLYNNEKKLVGSVSSFGFGGTNAHAILKEADEYDIAEKAQSTSLFNYAYIGLSSNSKKALVESLKNLQSTHAGSCWEKIKEENSSMLQRLELKEQFYCFANDKENFKQVLESAIDEKESLQYFYASRFKMNPKVALLFTGQGNEYTGMFKNFYVYNTFFKSIVDEVLFKAQKYFPINLFKVWGKAEFQQELSETHYAQILLFAFEYAFAQCLISEGGLHFDVVFGHGVGEIVAATVAGVMSLDHAIDLVCIRGSLMREAGAAKGSRIFEASTKMIKYSPLQKGMVSSLSGEYIPSDFDFRESYWSEQLRDATELEKAIKTLEASGCNVFIEIGPSPILTTMAQKIVEGNNHSFIYFINPKMIDVESISLGILKLEHLKLLSKNILNIKPNANLTKTIMSKMVYWAEGNQVKLQNNSVAESGQIDNILYKLTEILSNVIRTEASNINVDEPLIDLGVDSLDLLSAVQIIKDTFEVAIPISEVFKNLNTLRKIAQFIDSETVCITGPALNVEASDSMVAMFQNQLTIIQNQLQILGMGKTLGEVKKEVPAPKASSTKGLANLETEKRGVLGNFRTHAITEASAEKNHTKKLFLEKTITAITEKTKKTKRHVQAYRKNLADNRISAGFRPDTKEMLYPIHCSKAHGSRFVDMDNNTFIDFTMGFGVNLFGHSPDFLNQALKEQFEKGICVGPQSDLAGPVAKLFCEITGHERVAFVNSGTEAVMTAIRLARAYHKKSKIVIFDGSYHGHFDGVLAKGTKHLTSLPVASGITQNMVNDVLVLEYGNPESIRIIKEHIKELAAIVVEPVQSRFPELQPLEFLMEIRELTSENDVAFIWDEVITGFRIAIDGAQGYFGIRADIASYGKVLGGGMPIGAVGGSSKYLDFIDGGDWEFGDDSYPKNEITFFAGTFSKHPLAMATTYATLKKLKEEGKYILEELNSKTQKLAKELNLIFEELNLDIKIHYFGTLFRFKGSVNLDLLFTKLIEKGFYIWEGRNCFLSTAHSDQDLLSFRAAVKESCQELQAVQFYPSLSSEKVEISYDLTPHQLRFWDLEKKGGSASCANNICVSAKIKGHLDVAKLRKSFEIIAEKRDIFRWNLDRREGKQFFSSKTKNINFEMISFRSIDRPWKIMDEHLLALSQTVFDFIEESPMKVKLFDVVEQTHLLAVVTNHIAFDGWSMTLFFEDLAVVYNSLLAGREPQLRSALGFEEVVRAPIIINKDDELKLVSKFSFPNQVTSLVSDLKKDKLDYKGERIVFDLDLATYEALKIWCKQNKITPFMLLYTSFAKVLFELFGKDKLTVAIPAANRDVPGTEVMYGCCANLVPVTIENTDKTILGLVGHVKQKIVEGYQTMNYPYELLKTKTGPVADVYFNLEPTSDLPKLDNATLLIYPFLISSCEFPLMLNITDFEHYYHCEIDFQTLFLTDDQVLKIVERMRKSLTTELTKKPVLE